MSKPVTKPNDVPPQQQDVAVFMKYVFFFVLFFLILLLIASFGTVAEAKTTGRTSGHVAVVSSVVRLGAV
jgi:hypothetical protein